MEDESIIASTKHVSTTTQRDRRILEWSHLFPSSSRTKKKLLLPSTHDYGSTIAHPQKPKYTTIEKTKKTVTIGRKKLAPIKIKSRPPTKYQENSSRRKYASVPRGMMVFRSIDKGMDGTLMSSSYSKFRKRRSSSRSSKGSFPRSYS